MLVVCCYRDTSICVAACIDSALSFALSCFLFDFVCLFVCLSFFSTFPVKCVHAFIFSSTCRHQTASTHQIQNLLLLSHLLACLFCFFLYLFWQIWSRFGCVLQLHRCRYRWSSSLSVTLSCWNSFDFPCCCCCCRTGSGRCTLCTRVLFSHAHVKSKIFVDFSLTCCISFFVVLCLTDFGCVRGRVLQFASLTFAADLSSFCVFDIYCKMCARVYLSMHTSNPKPKACIIAFADVLETSHTYFDLHAGIECQGFAVLSRAVLMCTWVSKVCLCCR